MFKLGDRVKTPEGWIGEISMVRLGNVKEGTMEYWVTGEDVGWFTEDQLSKPRGRKPKDSENLTIGDKVKANNGPIGIIKEITNDEEYIIVSPDGGVTYKYPKDMLKKLTKDNKEETQHIHKETKSFGYTISTLFFDTKEEAEKQLEKWMKTGDIFKGTKVYEVTKVYKPSIKLEEE